MSRAQESTVIIERQSGNPVNAILHKELDELELIDAEAVWSPERFQALRELKMKGRPTPEHVHWDWAMKGRRFSNLLAFKSFGIEANGMMQGLMMVSLTGRTSRIDPEEVTQPPNPPYNWKIGLPKREFRDSIEFVRVTYETRGLNPLIVIIG